MMMMAKLALLAVLGISTAFDRNDHGIHGEMIAVYAAPASGSPDDGSREHIIARYTPMAADGMSLDLAKVPAYAEFVAARNISNVMPAGSNGESLSLTVAEREALLEAWVAAAAPLKLNVYMHIGSESIVDSIELARHAGTVKGCKGIVSMTPVYFKPTVDSLIEFLAPVAAAAPELPFWSARRRFFRVGREKAMRYAAGTTTSLTTLACCPAPRTRSSSRRTRPARSRRSWASSSRRGRRAVVPFANFDRPFVGLQPHGLPALRRRRRRQVSSRGPVDPRRLLISPDRPSRRARRRLQRDAAASSAPPSSSPPCPWDGTPRAR